MTSRLLFSIACLSLCAAAARADDAPTAPSARDMLKARLAEEAKKTPSTKAGEAPAPAPITPTAANALAPKPADPAEKNPIVATAGAPAADSDKAQKAKAKAEPAAVLPKVEVRKGRITELDHKLAEQEREIARERKNMKSSEVDTALNDAKIAKPLAIFGGESSQFRKRVSSERVSLMEDEKDLIEAIAHAKTKEEKAELQKQLDFLRAERRELEKALR